MMCQETVLNGHAGCVRDVSWHGEQLDLVSEYCLELTMS